MLQRLDVNPGADKKLVTSCLVLKLVVVCEHWGLAWQHNKITLFWLTIWSSQAITHVKRGGADSFMKCLCECWYLGALSLIWLGQVQPCNILSALLSSVLSRGSSTKAHPGRAVYINYCLHHLDVGQHHLLASSNSICVTCVWDSLSMQQLDARPPAMTLLCSPLSSVPLSWRSICTIALFFRHSLFWGPCFFAILSNQMRHECHFLVSEPNAGACALAETLACKMEKE